MYGVAVTENESIHYIGIDNASGGYPYLTPSIFSAYWFTTKEAAKQFGINEAKYLSLKADKMQVVKVHTEVVEEFYAVDLTKCTAKQLKTRLANFPNDAKIMMKLKGSEVLEEMNEIRFVKNMIILDAGEPSDLTVEALQQSFSFLSNSIEIHVKEKDFNISDVTFDEKAALVVIEYVK